MDKAKLPLGKPPTLVVYVLAQADLTRELCNLLLASVLDREALKALYFKMNELDCWFTRNKKVMTDG